jgi:hypothetical protein
MLVNDIVLILSKKVNMLILIVQTLDRTPGVSKEKGASSRGRH